MRIIYPNVRLLAGPSIVRWPSILSVTKLMFLSKPLSGIAARFFQTRFEKIVESKLTEKTLRALARAFSLSFSKYFSSRYIYAALCTF